MWFKLLSGCGIFIIASCSIYKKNGQLDTNKAFSHDYKQVSYDGGQF